MTETTSQSKLKVTGLLAQFDDPDSLLVGCEKVRKAGYTKTDAYVPFPVHGIDEALGIKPSILPWLVFALGLSGGLGGLAMQFFMNAVDYPFIISAKPMFSLPANIPVTFELTILLSAFGTFFGMLVLNRMARFSNPLFRVPEFARATDDRFFLSIEGTDPKYKEDKVRKLLADLPGATVIDVLEDPSDDKLPAFLWYAPIIVLPLLLLPPVFLWKSLYETASVPRIHPILDMDIQMRADTQTTSPIFADGRTMRPRIIGTVARGEFSDPILMTGILPDSEETPVVFLQEEDEPAEPPGDTPTGDTDEPNQDKPEAKQEDEKQSEDPAAQDQPADGDADQEPNAEAPADGNAEQPPMEPEPNWVKRIPVDVTVSMIERGRQRYNIYCSVCHGVAGDGDGLVAQQALNLGSPQWVPPTPMHVETVVNQPDGKLFNTITHGIRKMKGYGDQIPAEDRWAIVSYIRALQKTRNGKASEVPDGVLP